MPTLLNTTQRFGTLLSLALTVGLLASCGGREGADEPSPSATSDTATPEAAAPRRADDASPQNEAIFTEREEAALRNLVEQRRRENPQRPRYTSIELEPGRDEIDLPNHFPADVPIPRSGRPQRHVSSAQDGTMTVVAIEDSVNGAYEFYIDELEAEGWYVESAGSQSNLTMLSASKGDRMIAVAITDANGQTTVTLIESDEAQ